MNPFTAYKLHNGVLVIEKEKTDPKFLRYSENPKTRAYIRCALIDRDGGLFCAWCKKTLTLKYRQSDPDFATIDHIVARAEGGSNAFENLCLACKACNEKRGAETQQRVELKRQQESPPTKVS